MPGFPELAQHLTQALKSLQMYQAAHPRSQEALANARASLEAWLAEKAPLQVNVSNGKAFVDGQPHEGGNPHVAFLVKLLAERQVAGFVFERGFAPEELLGTLESLLLKPARIEEGGGMTAILDSKGVKRIRVSTTQYREVGGEDEEATGVTGFFRVPDRTPGTGEAPSLSKGPSDPEVLLGALRETLLALTRSAPDGLILPKPGDSSPLPLAPAEPSLLPELGSKLSLPGGPTPPSPNQLVSLRQAAMSLPPAQQLSLISSLATAPAGSEGVTHGLRSMVPEVLASAIASLMQQGYTWTQLEGSVSKILRPFADRAAIAAATGAQLQGMGVDPGPLGGLVQNMDWEDVSLQSKVGKLLEEGKLLEIPADHRLAFLRDLLDKRMDEAFLRGLDQLLEGLRAEAVDTRRSAAQTLAGATRWALEPRLPSEAEKLLRQRLPRPFINEADETTHRWISEALAEMVLVWVEQGELAQGTSAVEALHTRMVFDSGRAPWKAQAMMDFEAKILSTRGREAAIGALFRTEREQLLVEVEPYLRWQGPAMAKRLVERLEQEQDRTKRGRIMDGLRLMADLALPPLEEALKSSSWFLVRNALLLVSELGNQSHAPKVVPLLRHSEPRVCRAAVRAAWKLGGPAAEQALLGHLRDADPVTQTEILFALGQIHGEASGPALVEIASDKKAPERLRVEVLKAMQGIHAPTTVPALVELIRRKGLFGGGAESGAVRVAAAQALAAVGTPDAKAQLKRLVEAEPKGLERDVMAKLVS